MSPRLPWAAALAGGLAAAVAAAAPTAAASLSTSAVAAQQEPVAPDGVAAVADAVLGAMDRTVQPCTDFFRYACGGWADRTPLPADKDTVGRSIPAMIDRTTAWLAASLRPGGALADARPGVLFRTCVAAAADGAASPPPATLADLAPALLRNGTTGSTPPPSLGAIMAALGEQHASGVGGGVLWRLAVEPVFETGGQVIKLRPPESPTGSRGVNRTGTPVGDARRALATDALAFACRAGWAANCTSEGVPSDDLIDAALGLELQLAAVPVGEAMARMSLANAPALATYLAAADVKAPEELMVLHVAYFEALLKFLDDPAFRAILPVYFAYAVTVDLAKRDLLGADMTASWLAFLSVRDPDLFSERPSVEERCTQRAVRGLPDEVARAWVAANVAPADTAAMAAIFNDTRTAAAAAVAATSWLDGPSKAAALRKINDAEFRNGGDPVYDPYSDVSMVATGGGAYANNVLAVSAASWRRVIAPLTSAAAAARWRLPAFAFDASYFMLANRVTMTSAVQQWPLFPPAAAKGVPAALAYGGAGYVAGHELGHSLDNTGILFNSSGKLVPLTILSPASSVTFRNRTNCLVDQYSAYTVEQLGDSPPVRVNGAITLGENMADAFGVRVAADALRAALRSRLAAKTVAASNPVLAKEFTDEQLYWVAVAQTWCIKRSDANLRRKVEDGPHSPEFFRVLGPASQAAAFASAFACPVGSPYRPKQTCTVYGA